MVFHHILNEIKTPFSGFQRLNQWFSPFPHLLPRDSDVIVWGGGMGLCKGPQVTLMSSPNWQPFELSFCWLFWPHSMLGPRRFPQGQTHAPTFKPWTSTVPLPESWWRFLDSLTPLHSGLWSNAPSLKGPSQATCPLPCFLFLPINYHTWHLKNYSCLPPGPESCSRMRVLVITASPASCTALVQSMGSMNIKWAVCWWLLNPWVVPHEGSTLSVHSGRRWLDGDQSPGPSPQAAPISNTGRWPRLSWPQRGGKVGWSLEKFICEMEVWKSQGVHLIEL